MTTSPWDTTLANFKTLFEIMAKLRDPDGGCPWDLEQDFSSIAPYTIEEAYEVADAIQRNSMHDLCEELGDLLLQVVFHTQMATEAGHFTLSDVATGINNKMIRRHPHVFDTSAGELTSEQQTAAWEQMKAEERKSKSSIQESALDGVAVALPALTRSEKLQKRAARTGFDWTDPKDIFDKLEEETEEVREAATTGDQEDIEEEIGDLLFVCANLARRLKIDPEQALIKANSKFERRFHGMEAEARLDGKDFAALSLEQQEALWLRVKGIEKRGRSNK